MRFKNDGYPRIETNNYKRVLLDGTIRKYTYHVVRIKRKHVSNHKDIRDAIIRIGYELDNIKHEER